MMRFRGRPKGPRLDPDQARRQGEITRLALLLLGQQKAIEFLNGDNAELGGRPLDLAIASIEGRDGVEAVLGRLISHPAASPPGDTWGLIRARVRDALP
jgi:hypothetical protein